MAVRTTMASLIARVRLLINDPASGAQQFADQDIQDILDESRIDIKNGSLDVQPTYTNATIQYLDYYSSLGGWEDGMVLKQYLITVVTPTISEPITGHWQFAASTLPPVFISGSSHDIYRAAADLLERWAARWVLSYNINVDGQSLQRSQVATALQNLAHTYRLKQRASRIHTTRIDLNRGKNGSGLSLDAHEIDYMASGDGR
jgi:hypothetical protein